MALNGLDINTLDDVEAACLVYELYKRMQQCKERKKIVTNRRWWVHPLNLKRPQEGQFKVTFSVLRQYPEEFFKDFRMSVSSFDNLLTLIGEHVRKQNTVFRLTIPPEERLAAKLR
ncbi:uncharacterized protein LOC112592671 [Melanaphis sacchari]|uniref:uncharacterized protein LOC112592671 n=1 Tax=Melanaphis sacchari TaxID=742174 RepID=UPI000DC14836|nr:uncharacterized protein LOC112592671 [Melanaphis sacchari]